MQLMSLIQATDRIYYLSGQAETDQPFLYYVKGRDYSVAIDAGQSKRHVELFYQAIKEKGFALPRFTLITHWHWDHTFGLPYVQGKTIANELTRQKLIEVSRWVWTEEAMAQRERTGQDIPMCNQCIRREYPNLNDIRVETADVGISESMELDLGGVHLILYPRDSIHSRDALLIYSPQEKALFVGDADCEDSYDNNGKADPDRLRAYLQFLEALDCDMCYLGHDIPETKEKVIKYLEELSKKE